MRPTSTSSETAPLLDHCVPVIQSLLQYWAKVYRADRGEKHRDDVTPGYREARSRLDAFKSRKPPPSMVSILYGPTGAGKSTLFHELTGIEVPIDVRRPWTFGCLVAVPGNCTESQWLQAVFPDDDVQPYTDSDQLR